jgi:gamma-glutamyltranspeptidase/glutathione hydrolase
MIVPGTGVVLNNQMDDFSISPGVPNAFGLIGSKANAIEPGKRPLSSMSPTMVLDPLDQPVMTCGAAGGPRIINATLQTLLRCLDLDAPIGDAIAASRLHHQWQPDILSCEGSLGRSFDRDEKMPNLLIDQLKTKGHDIKLASTLAIVQGIQRVPGQPNQKNQWTAACDPRAEGVPASD